MASNKHSMFSKAWITLAVLTTPLVTCADNIERIVLGQDKNSVVKPWTGMGFTKVKTIDGVTYGLTSHKDSVGNFEKFTVDKSTDGGYTWTNNPQTVVTNSDIAAIGTQTGKNYNYNRFEAIKWFQCNATGKWSIYAKRLNATANGNIDYVNGKQLFGATVVDPAGELDSPYSAMRLDFPYGSASGDLGNTTVNGKNYIISTGRDDHTIRFLELTPDCSNIVNANVAGAQPAKTLQWYKDNGAPEPREAPALFTHNGNFYMITSGATGWRPNQQKYAWAPSFLGTWSDMYPIGDRTAYHSQVFWVRGITAENDATKQAKLFTGTRNAQVWNGSDSRDVITPIYFNTPDSIATNHYDYIDINHTTGDVTGGRYDHGTRLDISQANLVNYGDNVSNLIDGNLASSWHKGNVSGKDVIVLDIGQSKLVKALKVKQYDNFNPQRPGEVEQKVFKVKVEVGDGNSYTNVFEDYIPSISWLQPLNLTDSNGRYIKITRLETHNGGNSAVQKHFGFYEIEVWGESAAPDSQISDDFEANTETEKAATWVTTETNNTSARITNDIAKGKVLSLADFNASDSVYVAKEFTGQSGSNLELNFDFKPEVIGAGEKLRLLDGSTIGFELINSPLVNGLAIANSKTDHVKIADLTAHQWYKIKAIISTDSRTFDVYLDDNLIWGGALLQNPLTEINKMALSSGWAQTGYTGHFDNIDFKGPLHSADNGGNDGNGNGDSGGNDGDGNGGNDGDGDGDDNSGTTPLLIDTFDNGTSQWQLTKGTWSIQQENGNNILAKTSTNDSGYVSAGDMNWTNYSVSADVKRGAQMAGILGRYQSDKKYYQLAIKSNGTYILNRNNNGTWKKLISGTFANSTSQYYNLKMVFNGNQIKVIIDGVELATVSDNTFSSGKVGFRSQNGVAKFDNLRVE